MNDRITIGYGLMIEDDAFNELRRIELAVEYKANIEDGLYQPPHITIKRPFEIGRSRLDDAVELLNSFARDSEGLKIKLRGIQSFGNEAFFFESKNRKIIAQHKKLVSMVEQNLGITPGDFDGDSFVAHCTIAMGKNLDSSTHKKLFAEYEGFTLNTHIKRVGLFLNVDQRHWVVIAQSSLMQ